MDKSKEKLIEILIYCNLEVHGRPGIFHLNQDFLGMGHRSFIYYVSYDDVIVTMVPSPDVDKYDLFTPHDVLNIEVDDLIFNKIWDHAILNLKTLSNDLPYLEQKREYNKLELVLIEEKIEKYKNNLKYKDYLE